MSNAEISDQGLAPNTFYLHRVSSTMSVAFLSREVHIMHLKESSYFIVEEFTFIYSALRNFVTSRVLILKFYSFKKDQIS